MVSKTNECADIPINTDELDSNRLKILGYDLDANGVRDDIDSLIDSVVSDSSEKELHADISRKLFKQSGYFIYDNSDATYEELVVFSAYTSLWFSLLNDCKAKKI